MITTILRILKEENELRLDEGPGLSHDLRQNWSSQLQSRQGSQVAVETNKRLGGHARKNRVNARKFSED